MCPPLIVFVIAGLGLVVAAVRFVWRRRRRLPLREIVTAAGAAGAVLLGAPLGDPSLVTRALVVRDGVQPVDAVFVLSGDVDFHRTLAGAREFHDARARWFVLSGAGSGGDNAEEMARVAVGAGVPREAILLEPLATSTRENVVFVEPLLEAHAITRIAVVTSATHSLRASLAAKRAWGDRTVLSRPTPDDDPADCPVRAWEREPRCRSGVLREWEKVLGYLLRGWL